MNQARIHFRRQHISISILLTCLLCMLANICMSQPDRIYFDHITTDEGLSQNDVNCILQDRKGFIWFGTNDGLNRYDGYEFTIFKPESRDPNAINSNLVFSLAEDSKGRIWVGTVGSGLNCYDPNSQKFFPFQFHSEDSASLGSNHVRDLWVDHLDRVWVATINGLYLYQLERLHGRESGQLINLTKSLIPPELQTGFIYEIFQENEQLVWIGTSDALYRVDLPQVPDQSFQATLINVDAFPSNRQIRSIVKDKSGMLIVGMSSGLFYQTGFDKNDHPTFRQVSSRYYSSLIVDNFQHLWAASTDGLDRFGKSGSDPVPRLIRTYRNDLDDPHSLNKDVLRTILADRNGMIWLGTNGGGVNKFDPGKMSFHHFKKNLQPGSLAYDKIRSMLEDSEGNLWIGTEGGGLDFLAASKQNGTFEQFEHLRILDNVFALAEVQQGEKKWLYFGGQNQVSFYKMLIPSSSESPARMNPSPIHEIDNSVFALLNDMDQTLWIGTYNGGIYRMKLPSDDSPIELDHYLHDTRDSQSISSNIVRSLTKDKAGNIWVGTGNGLNMIPAAHKHDKRPHFIRYSHQSNDWYSLSHNYILPVFESQDSTLWIGTFGGGLNRFVPTKNGKQAHFVRYTEQDGLANNVVKAILEDEEGYLWMSTNRGLSRFDPHTETFKNYDTHDGLQSNEFSELASLKRSSGEMFFGGVNGFNAFMPQSLRVNSYLPKVVYTGFEVLNKPIQAGDKLNDHVILDKSISETDQIDLRYDENSFSLAFAALHYSGPGKNQYMYKLEGFDDNWIAVSAQKRSATYTNLSPGDYTIHVKASNNDGVWNENPSSIRISISPPFWLTWWAYTAYALLIIGLLAAFRRYTIIGIKEKHDLVLEHLEKEKAEELHQMKLQFFTNISHELRTPLTLISGPLEYLIKSGQGLDYDQRENQYRLIHKNANYLLRLVNQLLDFRRLDQGKMKLAVQKSDVVAFIQEITEPFQFISNKRQISYNILSKQPQIDIWFDPDVLEKTIYNLLSNAFKYTPERGRITIGIDVLPQESIKGNPKTSKGLVEIRVLDTGPGIPIKKQRQIFDRFYKSPQTEAVNKSGTGIGLAFTKKLVHLHHGSIKVESKPGTGSCFIIQLPMGRSIYRKQEIAKRPSPIFTGAFDPLSYLSDSPDIDLGDNAEAMRSREADLPLLLVIDDYEDIRSFIQQSLKQEFRILEAEDGTQGLELVHAHSPDMIISDVMMPGVDGIELCQRLKTDPKTSHIPILLLTAKSSEESELTGLTVGADAYVRKPFNIDLLKARMNNILSQRQELKNKFRREILLEPETVTVTSADEVFLKKAMDIVEEHMGDPDFSVESMVREIGMSRSKLYLKLKALTDQSTSEFIRSVRLKRAVQLLEKSDMTVKEIMYMTGFNTASYFSKCFKKQFGVSPSDYLKKESSAQ